MKHKFFSVLTTAMVIMLVLSFVVPIANAQAPEIVTQKLVLSDDLKKAVDITMNPANEYSINPGTGSVKAVLADKAEFDIWIDGTPVTSGWDTTDKMFKVELMTSNVLSGTLTSDNWVHVERPITALVTGSPAGEYSISTRPVPPAPIVPQVGVDGITAKTQEFTVKFDDWTKTGITLHNRDSITVNWSAGSGVVELVSFAFFATDQANSIQADGQWMLDLMPSNSYVVAANANQSINLRARASSAEETKILVTVIYAEPLPSSAETGTLPSTGGESESFGLELPVVEQPAPEPTTLWESFISLSWLPF